jgi:hypothetical protein
MLDFYGYFKAGFFIPPERIKVKQKKAYFFLTRLEDRLLEEREEELREEELRLELELREETIADERDELPRLLERELTEGVRLREAELRLELYDREEVLRPEL